MYAYGSVEDKGWVDKDGKMGKRKGRKRRAAWREIVERARYDDSNSGIRSTNPRIKRESSGEGVMRDLKGMTKRG